MYIVTRYIDGAVVTYTADNWAHVGCLIATEKLISWERVS